MIQTINETGSAEKSEQSREIERFVDAVEKLIPLLDISSSQTTKINSAVASMKNHASDPNSNKSAIVKSLSIIGDIARSATGSAIGAGIVAMITQLIAILPN